MARLTLREVITEALREEMQRDEDVFIMGEEVGAWGGTYAVTKGFLEEFGENRVRDTPISEMVIAGAAVGAAMAGTRPVAEFMTINFAFVAFDAIVNHAAKVSYMFNGQFDCPLVFRAPGGGGKQDGDSVFGPAAARHGCRPGGQPARWPGVRHRVANDSALGPSPGAAFHEWSAAADARRPGTLGGGSHRNAWRRGAEFAQCVSRPYTVAARRPARTAWLENP